MFDQWGDMQATGESLESQVAAFKAELGTGLMASLSPAERGELATINPNLQRLQVSTAFIRARVSVTSYTFPPFSPPPNTPTTTHTGTTALRKHLNMVYCLDHIPMAGHAHFREVKKGPLSAFV